MKSKHLSFRSLVVCVILLLVGMTFADPNTPSLPSPLPDDLVDVQYPSLDGLAPGSEEAQERQRQAAQELGLPVEVRTRNTGIVLRLIPAGTFTMGSPASEADRYDDEGPQHQVTLTKAFYCGKFEVTQGQWESVMGSNASLFEEAGSDAPVDNVWVEDCQAFLKRLCQMEGVAEGTYRLLTEAEWEYACRAGTTGAYCFGDDESVLDEYAWFSKNSDWLTHPVGQKKPNAFGLHDMHGNVLEWCQNWCGAYPSEPVTDPLGPVSGGGVCRGGGWLFGAGVCRSACRGWGGGAPGGRFNVLGLRLARTMP
jgi:formylglycine-generating enzyme required for sulfatase activity